MGSLSQISAHSIVPTKDAPQSFKWVADISANSLKLKLLISNVSPCDCNLINFISSSLKYISIESPAQDIWPIYEKLENM